VAVAGTADRHADAHASEVSDAQPDAGGNAHADRIRHLDRDAHTHSGYGYWCYGDAHPDQLAHRDVDAHSNAHCDRHVAAATDHQRRPTPRRLSRVPG